MIVEEFYIPKEQCEFYSIAEVNSMVSVMQKEINRLELRVRLLEHKLKATWRYESNSKVHCV